MTFATLRALHMLIGDALEEIEHIYRDASADSSIAADPEEFYASPPPSPPFNKKDIDFPSLEDPYEPSSQAEQLTSHPTVSAGINRIIAACGQISATVQTPFLTLSDAGMGYHLPSSLRLLEAAHCVEIMREAGPGGITTEEMGQMCGVEPSKLAHVLRLLSTHHITLEVSPSRFTNNRISSSLDSGKSYAHLMTLSDESRPEEKYAETNGVAAFVGMCTDELFKSSAYLTEAYLLSSRRSVRWGREPTKAPFNHAFGCEGIGFFGWLEGEVGAGGVGLGNDPGHTSSFSILPSLSTPKKETWTVQPQESPEIPKKSLPMLNGRDGRGGDELMENPNKFRLVRFGKAMSGTGGWEVPGGLLLGFDWAALPHGAVIVDVGGGIGSSSMLLASAPITEQLNLRYIIQDREIVVGMGEKAWRDKCPEYLEKGVAGFQVHDFFTPQPVKNASVFLLRVILHDWPDNFAQKILLRLRESATPQTKLLLADWVLPLACEDDFGMVGDVQVKGAERTLAPKPLLPNLGKASANAYWMDLTMQVMFNGQERTLREIVALCASAGWKIIKVSRPNGSLFGYMTAVPIEVNVREARRRRAGSGSAWFEAQSQSMSHQSRTSLQHGEEAKGTRSLPSLSSFSSISSSTMEDTSRSEFCEEVDDSEQTRMAFPPNRSGTPTFGSRMKLSSMDDELRPERVGELKLRSPFGGIGALGNARRGVGGAATGSTARKAADTTSYQIASLAPLKPRKKSSTLSINPTSSLTISRTPAPASPRRAATGSAGQALSKSPSRIAVPSMQAGESVTLTPSRARKASMPNLRPPAPTTVNYSASPLPVLQHKKSQSSLPKLRTTSPVYACTGSVTQPVSPKSRNEPPVPPLPRRRGSSVNLNVLSLSIGGETGRIVPEQPPKLPQKSVKRRQSQPYIQSSPSSRISTPTRLMGRSPVSNTNAKASQLNSSMSSVGPSSPASSSLPRKTSFGNLRRDGTLDPNLSQLKWR